VAFSPPGPRLVSIVPGRLPSTREEGGHLGEALVEGCKLSSSGVRTRLHVELRRPVPRWRSGLGFRASVTYASTWSRSVCHPLAPDGWGGNDSADCRRPLPSVARTVTTWPPAAGCHT